MGNCFGRRSKRTIATAKESETRSQKAKIPRKIEDYYSSSTFDVDDSAFQTQESISPFSMSTVDPQGGANNSGAHSEFVNHGLILWNQMRQQWIGNKKSEDLAEQPREPKLNFNVTYEILLGSDEPFPHPIPLSEAVYFLEDIWEQEGIYD